MTTVTIPSDKIVLNEVKEPLLNFLVNPIHSIPNLLRGFFIIMKRC